MTVIRQGALAIAAMVLTAGCAPLQQAPLVYASKVVVGLDVSSNATESPGISINIGVKTIDVAYVPVAVSKTLDDHSRTDARAPGITRIEARYGQGTSDGDGRELTQENKQKINEYIKAQKVAADAADRAAREATSRAAIEQQRLAIAAVRQAIEALGPAPVTPDVATAMQPAAQSDLESARKKRAASIQDINNRLAAINDGALQPIPDADADLTPFLARLAGLQSTLPAQLAQQTKAAEAASADAASSAARADELFTEAARAASLLKTSKSDAMSVYGRFDSDGAAASSSASGASATLLVGKVFSTGLASQNLTEAAKIAAVNSCLSTALTAIGAGTAGDTAKMELLTMIASSCGGANSK